MGITDYFSGANEKVNENEERSKKNAERLDDVETELEDFSPQNDDVADSVESLVTNTLDVSGWRQLDVSNHGYKGDKSGGDIVELFRDNPNHCFVLPPGDYSVQSQLDLHGVDKWDQLSIIAPRGARLVVDDPSVDYFLRVGGYNSSAQTFDRLSLRNLTLAVDGANNLDAGWGRWWVNDVVDNRNLKLEGKRDFYGADDPGDKFAYYTCMTTPNGVGLHWNVQLPDGDIPRGGDQFDHAIGVGAEIPHVGTNLWMSPHLENWWDNGAYLKDGIGENIVIAPTMKNCGGCALRIGKSDTVIGGSSDWDLPRDPKTLENDSFYAESDEYPDPPDEGSLRDVYDGPYGRACKNGTCLDADEADATAVRGLRIEKRSGHNDAARFRSGSESATYENIKIDNYTSQNAVRITGTGKGVMKLDNVHVQDRGDVSVKGASVLVERSRVVLEDCSIRLGSAGGDRDAINVEEGVEVDVIRGFLSGAANHSVRVQDGVGRVRFSGTKFFDGIYFYPGSSVTAVTISDCNFLTAEKNFPGANPEDVVSYYDAGTNTAGPSTQSVSSGDSGNVW